MHACMHTQASVCACHVLGKTTATLRVTTVGSSFVFQGIVHDKQLVNLINNLANIIVTINKLGMHACMNESSAK